MFTISVERPPVQLAQGGKTRLRVIADRRGYDGPIAVELRSLPAGVTAAKGKIGSGQSNVELDVTADSTAGVGDTKDATAMGTPGEGDGKGVSSDPFTITVTRAAATSPALTLQAQPVILRMAQNSTAKVRVLAKRQGYDGPVVVELTNLPAGVKAQKATILAGKSDVDVPLTAAAGAALGDNAGVTAVGTTTGDSPTTVTSGPITISVAKVVVVPVPAPASFTLKLEPANLKLPAGGAGKLRVVAGRQGYDGAIVVEFGNAVAGVTIGKALIPAGQNAADVAISADAKTAAGAYPGLIAQGTAVKVNLTPVRSAAVTITVTAAAGLPGKNVGTFALRVQGAQFALKQGAKITVRVVADRKGGYQGPIHLTLNNLPANVTAKKETIKANEMTADLELHAAPKAVVGGRNDVVAVGTAKAAAVTQVTSPQFTVSVTAK
jgi:hypothetical protein